jgi:hypothetical protein
MCGFGFEWKIDGSVYDCCEFMVFLGDSFVNNAFC